MIPVALMEKIGSLSNESISEPLPSGGARCCTAFLTSAKLFGAGTLGGAVFISNRFLVQCPTEAGLIGAPVTWRGDGDTARPGCPITS